MTVPALIAAAVVLAGVGLLGDKGAHVAGAAVGAVLLLAAAWVRAGPPVRADTEGVTVRGLLRTRRLLWREVTALRVQEGRRSRALEFETADRLLVVPAYLLGRTPLRQAGAELSALRSGEPAPRSGPAGPR